MKGTYVLRKACRPFRCRDLFLIRHRHGRAGPGSLTGGAAYQIRCSLYTFAGRVGEGNSYALVDDRVGRETYATCHEAQTWLWSGSHHDLAMQEATERTVLCG